MVSEPQRDPRPEPHVLILGGSGLIGWEMARLLSTGLAGARAMRVTAVGRRFAARPGDATIASLDVVGLDARGLRDALARLDATCIVNCIGILQDGPDGSTEDVHRGFVGRLVDTLSGMDAPPTLLHISIPGDEAGDATAYARTKRRAEGAVRGSALPHVVLRPGLVIAPNAYGGSALIRALAATPLDLAREDGARPMATVAAFDLARTVAHVAADGPPPGGATWDAMHPDGITLDGIVDAHRDWLGGPRGRIRPPSWLTGWGARLGDLAGWLGWRPPLRTTAIRELRRGVAGDPGPWMAATGIEPLDVRDALAAHPAGVADRWFARLYLAKAVILATLAAFWAVSGLIALASYDEARAILLNAGFGGAASHVVTIASSLTDIAIGLLVAWRRTAWWGLWAGIAVSLLYMAGAAVLTPAMWLEPLGALVKTFPAIVLMGIALATLEDR